MVSHLFSPFRVFVSPICLVVEVCGDESGTAEASGGGCVGTQVGASVLGEPLSEVYTTHEGLLDAPLVEAGGASMFVKALSREVGEDLVVFEGGIAGDLEHVKNVGLLYGNWGVLRSERNDGEW